MNEHRANSINFLKDERQVDWHDQSLWWVRSKRDHAAQSVEDWEQLRDHASQIKEHTLSQLDRYLEEFESKATKNGIRIHWARDASEHNQIVKDIIEDHNARSLVKSKSMLTEECGLNDYLEDHGIEVVDSDLGERIIQWLEQSPSHIVMPAIHLKKREIGEIFSEKLKIAQTEDEKILTESARTHLRDKFLHTRIALTGVNFAIAETGSFVVCTNEGNADMGVHLADIHIASMGIEKLIPKIDDIGTFLRLLARSATGQLITTYTSHFTRPAKGKETHIILVDNNRSDILGKQEFWRALKCIRCGACMNTCPIYRRTGGHSYDATIPGPIGAILAPHSDQAKYSSLPFASSLCGSCSAVCPVKIDIDKQLYAWRQKIMRDQTSFFAKIGSITLQNHRLFNFISQIAIWLQRKAPWILRAATSEYNKGRKLPKAPENSFKQWFKDHEQ